MRHQRLPRSWTLRPLTEAPVDGPVPATVPGCVHTDLLAAGLIPDPYRDDNETRLGWIGRTDWAYETVFGWEDAGERRVDLVCEGLDTIADIELNGVPVGSARNMHRRYRFDLAGALRPGENRITVHFSAPYGYAEHWRAELGDRPAAYAEPYPFIRKMACNFGWDWGPTLVTSGIWRPIGLEAWSVASARPLAIPAVFGPMPALRRSQQYNGPQPAPRPKWMSFFRTLRRASAGFSSTISSSMRAAASAEESSSISGSRAFSRSGVTCQNTFST